MFAHLVKSDVISVKSFLFVTSSYTLSSLSQEPIVNCHTPKPELKKKINKN